MWTEKLKKGNTAKAEKFVRRKKIDRQTKNFSQTDKWRWIKNTNLIERKEARREKEKEKVIMREINRNRKRKKVKER